MADTPAVLIVRHPDAENAITTYGDVHVLDIDLGSQFDGVAESLEQWEEWAAEVTPEVEKLPEPLRAIGFETIRSAKP